MFRKRDNSPPHSPAAAGSSPESDSDDVVAIDESNFSERTAGAFTIVDFWAPWCAPCIRFRPAFHEVAAQFGDELRFGACNVDENPQIGALLQIMSIPTLVLFDHDGNEAGRVVGAPSRAAFEQMVRDVAQHAAGQAAGHASDTHGAHEHA